VPLGTEISDSSLRALDRTVNRVRAEPSLMIQAMPLWLDLLDPVLVPAQVGALSDGPARLECRSAECLRAITMDTGPPSFTPRLHLDAASRALAVEATSRIFAWAEHFLRVCLDDPLGPRAEPFWPILHAVFRVADDRIFQQEFIFRIAMPLWIAEANDFSVRVAESKLCPSGQFMGVGSITILLDFVSKEDTPLSSPLSVCFESVGSFVVETACQHVYLLPLKEVGPPTFYLALQAGACLSSMTRYNTLRKLPGLLDERLLYAFLRLYAYHLRCATELAEENFRESAWGAITSGFQYLLFAFRSDSAVHLIECAIAHGLLPLLFQTRPWEATEDHPKGFAAGDSPLAYMFEKIIVGHMVVLPIFSAVSTALRIMQDKRILPTPETRQWYDQIVQRLGRWDVPYQRALDVRAAVKARRRRSCFYSRVSSASCADRSLLRQ
jgi:hypothetical protein